ncbi:MAG: ATP-binding domain-containing protein [candidate division KSB1 bacterium]|nr:ATP-binding domain-containing protein [candidate division KSB1 bacterium]MDZ7276607.1 ATP-binding domain-containing protein [candidate division KSB1 bacterium]MDZ7300389.1 ATP-binding domain-containing protein [candidate division KSB1 bacterium]MDZ7351389.1 ATP-binding domain-containing protein [candidate division KSB1 bacterium]MDZ7355661.1 ATP-binding domain-containing protein [candidate division KSB1 bacterium]
MNCRNTRRIGEETALLSGFESPPYRMGQVEGPAVDYHYYHSDGEQAAVLSATLRGLLRDGVIADEVVVLSRLRFENSCASQLVDESEFRLVEVGAVKPERSHISIISFATIQAFKGMESPVVVLCDVDRIEGRESQSLLYVGMSRARSLLIVLLHEQTKPFVKQAVARKLEEGWSKSP